jgi:predicted O-methyltransferase YrrM
MEQELFDVLTALEMQDQQERAQNLPREQRIRALHPHSAKLLAMLAISNKAQNIVEIGARAGYSTLWLAYAASITGGQVITCEIDPARAGEARINLKKANMANYVELLVGDARELLRHRDEAIDLVFIDAAKEQYETYFDVVYKHLGVGSMVVADNAVSHEDELLDYKTYVQNHPNLESVTVPIGRGLEITVKTVA